MIGRDSLSANTGVSRRSVRTCLNYLKSTNRIAIRTTNRYSIVSILKWDIYQGDDNANDQQNGQQDDQQATSKRPASDHIEEVKEVKNVKNKKQRVVEYTTEFLLFWKVYPRQIGKQVAFESYRRIVPQYPHEDVIEAAREYAEQCVKDQKEEKFILHPSTFLNKGRWKDYCFDRDGPQEAKEKPGAVA